MNDDDLLSQVRAAFDALDPVPGEVLAASRSAFAWRMPSAGLAELTGDRDRPAAGVRGGAEGTTRSLAFAGAGLTVEI